MTESLSVFDVYARDFILTNSQCHDMLRADLEDLDVPGLNHAILGVVSEVSELEQAVTKHNRDEELGDLIWFISLGMRSAGMQVSRAWASACEAGLACSAVRGEAPDPYRELRNVQAQLADRLKALMYYHSDVLKIYSGWKHPDSQDKEPYKPVLTDLLFRLARELVVILYSQEVEDVETEVSRLMQKNLAKLQARHGHKQVIDDTRDYTAEERAMSGVDSPGEIV